MDEATMYAHLSHILRRVADDLDAEMRKWLEPIVVKPAEPPEAPNEERWDVPPIFRNMTDKNVVTACARRIASMAAMGGYNEDVVPMGWAHKNSVAKPTDEMLTEMVKGREQEWENFAFIAKRLYEKGGWPRSLLATYLALIAPGWDVEREEVQGTIRRLTRNDGTPLAPKDLKRDFRRLLSWAEMDDGAVADSLRYWAGHCSWAHESVRATDE